MIVFDLRCAYGHRFEGWFRSADDFVGQRERGLLECPTCADRSVERVLSVPRINTGAEPPPAPVARGSDRLAEFEGKDPLAIAQILYSRFLDGILASTEDVGQEFAAEARRIHYEEAPARAIRGLASDDEHQALLDEGIQVAKIPLPPGNGH